MNKTETNVGKIPSITNEEFLSNLMISEEDCTMLKEKTLERITKEIDSILNQLPEGAFTEPDFKTCATLCMELYSYGFKFESYRNMNRMGNLIHELYTHQLPWFRLLGKSFHHYVIPDHLKYVKPNLIFPFKITLEHFHEENGCMKVEYFETGKEEPAKCLIAMSDLKTHALEQGVLHSLKDWPDHTGEHVEKNIKVPLYTFLQEKIDWLIKDYIESGKECYYL